MSGRILRRVEAGAGKTAVVLEAGRNDVAASWQAVMPLLAPHVHVVAYDRAGLRGGDTVASAAMLRELRSAPRPFPDVPVVVLSAARGFPRRFRAHWTDLQAGLAAAAGQGRHIVVDGVGHNIPRDRPDVVADAILDVVSAPGTA